MADEKAEGAGQPPLKIGRKPVASASSSIAATPAPPPPVPAPETAPQPHNDLDTDAPPPYIPNDTVNNEKRDLKTGHDGPSVPEPTAGTSSGGQDEQRPPMYIQIDKTKPEDFEGEIHTTNELPSPELIKKIDDYIVLDKHGKSYTFKSLYSGTNVARRVLVIFIRHFFCGNCQEYLRTLSEAISPESLLRLPVSTFILIIGCGEPSLIDFYAQETKCQFPIYTDPQRSLFKELGMTQTWDMGAKPTYMRKSMGSAVIASIAQGLRLIPTGKVLKSGNFRQVGGEFLFEPPDMVTPVTTPREERHIDGGHLGGNRPEDHDDCGRVESKRVTWCHRMKATRDHVEIPELMEILGLDEKPTSEEDQQKWDQALRKRKGTGSSMARQMSELSHQTG